MATKGERQKMIEEFMALGMNRDRAIIAAAIALGESDGDVLEIDGEEGNAAQAEDE